MWRNRLSQIRVGGKSHNSSIQRSRLIPHRTAQQGRAFKRNCSFPSQHFWSQVQGFENCRISISARNRVSNKTAKGKWESVIDWWEWILFEALYSSVWNEARSSNWGNLQFVANSGSEQLVSPHESRPPEIKWLKKVFTDVVIFLKRRWNCQFSWKSSVWKSLALGPSL